MSRAVRIPEANLPPPVILTYDMTVLTVPYTKEYKYLGAPFTDDMCPLREQAYLVKLTREALSAFMGNRPLNGCDISLQRDYFMGSVAGKVAHLLATTSCTVPVKDQKIATTAFKAARVAKTPHGAKAKGKIPSFDFERDMDDAMLDGAAYIFHTSTKYLRLTGLADLRMLPTTALLIRSYERFRLHALSRESPTSDMMRALLQDGNPASLVERRRTPRHMWSWVANYYDLIQRLKYPAEWRIPPVTNIARWAIHDVTSRTARNVAYNLFIEHAMEYNHKRTLQQAREPAIAARAPPPFLFRIQLHNLLDPVQDCELPQPGLFRPSLYGGGVGIPTTSMADRHKRPLAHVLLQRALLGRTGLFSAPFLPFIRTRETGVKRKRTDTTVVQLKFEKRSKSIFTDTDCNLCGNPQGDFIHLCTLCTHPAMVRRQEAALGNGRWGAYVSAITCTLYKAHSMPYPLAWLLVAIANLDVQSCEARFITAWLITGYAWPASSTEPEWRIATALGRLFDKDVPLSNYRPVATTWVTSQHAILSTVCLGWWKFLSPTERVRLEADGHILPPRPQRKQ